MDFRPNFVTFSRFQIFVTLAQKVLALVTLELTAMVMSDAERKSLKESLSVLDMLCSQAAAERA